VHAWRAAGDQNAWHGLSLHSVDLKCGKAVLNH
jgi:hypothetical protein